MRLGTRNAIQSSVVYDIILISRARLRLSVCSFQSFSELSPLFEFSGVPGEPHVPWSQRKRPGRGTYVSRRLQRQLLGNDPQICEHHCRTVLRPPALRHVPDRL